jgi:uncharacterized membrane protein YebE (DUF533 family)
LFFSKNTYIYRSNPYFILNMPVRIVKDDADESVLSDYFNFDNPQETSSNQDNGWGGGGSNNNNSNAGSGLFGFLGSLAINACINYAFQAFSGGGGGSNKPNRRNTQQNHFNREEADELLQERLASAELCVSLWAHIAFADGKMQQAERQAIDQLIRDTVGKLFPQDIADQTEASSILQKRLKSPQDYQTVVRQASNDSRFSLQLFEQACLLASSDYAIEDNENVFLANLANDLHLNPDDVAKIRSQYNTF